MFPQGSNSKLNLPPGGENAGLNAAYFQKLKVSMVCHFLVYGYFSFSSTISVLPLWCWGEAAGNETKGMPKFLSRQPPPSKQAQIHVELRKGLWGAWQSAPSCALCPHSMLMDALVKNLEMYDKPPCSPRPHHIMALTPTGTPSSNPPETPAQVPRSWSAAWGLEDFSYEDRLRGLGLLSLKKAPG